MLLISLLKIKLHIYFIYIVNLFIFASSFGDKMLA